jgi:hypothetical protein
LKHDHDKQVRSVRSYRDWWPIQEAPYKCLSGTVLRCCWQLPGCVRIPLNHSQLQQPYRAALSATGRLPLAIFVCVCVGGWGADWLSLL